LQALHHVQSHTFIQTAYPQSQCYHSTLEALSTAPGQTQCSPEGPRPSTHKVQNSQHPGLQHSTR
ncbi:unnamed protein product, partial [Coccothraustes coccothraustes]